MDKESVICIGAGCSQLEYISRIKQMGYYLFCTDINPCAQGFKYADAKAQVSTFDVRTTIEVIKNRIELFDNIKAVIAPCTGEPFRTAQEVKKLLGMGSLSSDKVDILLDKLLMREYLNSIGCSDIKVYNHNPAIKKEIFPLVKKIRFGGMGGRGVEILTEEPKEFAIENDFVYEQFIQGKELAVDVLWDTDKIVFISMGWTLFDSNLGIIIGATVGDNYFKDIRKKIAEKVLKFCESMKLDREALNIDIIIDDAGNVHILEVEFAPSDIIHLAKESYGYDFVDSYLKLHLNNNILRQPPILKSSAKILNVVGEDIYENIFKKECFSDGFYYVDKPIYEIKTCNGTRQVKGFFIITGDDDIALEDNINKFFPQIEFRRFTSE